VNNQLSKIIRFLILANFLFGQQPPTYLTVEEGDESVVLSWEAPGNVLYAGETCDETYQAINLTDGFSETYDGTTAGAQNDYTSINDFGNEVATGNDVVYEFNVEEDLEVTFSLCGGATWDTYLILLGADCEAQIASDDDGCDGLQSEILWTLSPGTYFLVVDAYSSGQGAYSLAVSASASNTVNGVYRPCITDNNKATINELVGSEITPLDEYNSGMEQTLNFNFHVESTDLEYAEGFILTFPTGWEVLGGTIAGESTVVDGNTITFGDPYAASGFGPFPANDYPFQVTVAAPDVNGDVIVGFFIGGDEYGVEPHTITGEFTLSEYVPEQGDLMGYKVYVNGTQYNDGLIGTNQYTVSELTNNTSYDFGVTANYFLDGVNLQESDPVTISGTPTFLFGDITGTITDVNNMVLSDVAVSASGVESISDENGNFTLNNLTVGIHTVEARKSGFYTSTADVQVLAQAQATEQNFEMSPDVPVPAGLSATAMDAQVHLSWRKPGNGDELILQYDDGIPSTWFYFYSSFEEGFGHGMRFDVGGQFDVMAASVRVAYEGDGEFWPAPNSTHGPVRVLIFDDNNGIPNNLLYDGEAVAENGWVTVYPSAYGLSGSVYVIASHTGNWQYDGDPEGFMIDDGVDYPENMYTFQEGLWSTGDALGYGGDYMMSVQVMSYGGNLQTLSSFENAPDISDNQNDVNELVSLQSLVNSYSGLFSINNLVPSSPIFNTPYLPMNREDELLEYRVYKVNSDGSEVFELSTEDTFAIVSASPNYLEYCYSVKAYWDTENYGQLESRSSNTSCTTPYKMGDADFNNVTDISDVLTVVNFVLEADMPTEDEFRNVDVNGDDQINIADVIKIVDIIFDVNAGRTLGFVSNEGVASFDLFIDSETNNILVDIENNSVIRGIQFDLNFDPNLVTIFSPRLPKVQENTIVTSNAIKDGYLKIIAANLSGNIIESDGKSFLVIPFEFHGSKYDISNISVDNINLVGADGSLIDYIDRVNSLDIRLTPQDFALMQNFPNPFNPTTEISFSLPVAGYVELSVYNMVGQKIRALSSENLNSGYHSVIWDGMNDAGIQAATGMYFYTIRTGNFKNTKKMLFLK